MPSASEGKCASVSFLFTLRPSRFCKADIFFVAPEHAPRSCTLSREEYLFNKLLQPRPVFKTRSWRRNCTRSMFDVKFAATSPAARLVGILTLTVALAVVSFIAKQRGTEVERRVCGMSMAFIASVFIAHSLSVRSSIPAAETLDRRVNLLEFLVGNVFNFLCVMITSPVYLVPIEVTQLWVARACAPRPTLVGTDTDRSTRVESLLLACATATCVSSIVLAGSSPHKACNSADEAKKMYRQRAWILAGATGAGLVGAAVAYGAVFRSGQNATRSAMTLPTALFLMSIVLHSGALVPALTSNLDKILPRALDVTRFDVASWFWILMLGSASLLHIWYQNKIPTAGWFGSMTDAALPVHQGSYIVLSGIVAYLFSGRYKETTVTHTALYILVMMSTLGFLTSYGIARTRAA